MQLIEMRRLLFKIYSTVRNREQAKTFTVLNKSTLKKI